MQLDLYTSLLVSSSGEDTNKLYLLFNSAFFFFIWCCCVYCKQLRVQLFTTLSFLVTTMNATDNQLKENAKSCFQALNGALDKMLWSISLCNNTKVIRRSFGP